MLPDGGLASGTEDNTIRVWNLGSGACDRVLEGHKGVREGDVYEQMTIIIKKLIIMTVLEYT